jgi:peroxiredoxin
MSMKRFHLLTVLALAMLCGHASAQVPAYQADLNAVLSQLQSMGRGSYTTEEWTEVNERIDDITRRAEKARDWNAAVDAQVIKAMVFSDMRGEHQAALNLLEDTKLRYGGRDATSMKKVYVREAEIYGKLGDEGAVRRIMDEFRASPYFDEESYAITVGEGRDTPVAIVRPSAGGSESLSITAMKVARQRTQFSPGNYFPSFALAARDGSPIVSDDYRGKVLLVDFWTRGWTPWLRDIESVKGMYERYHASGLEILGVCVEPDSADVSAFLRAQRMPWPQAAGGSALAKQLGIFGEATNYLIDRNGIIVARDLRGSDLVAAVRGALAE